jgi:hypothetical protein
LHPHSYFHPIIAMKNRPLVLATLLFTLFMVQTIHVHAQSPSDTPPQMENLNEEEPAITSGKKERIQQTEQTSQVGEQTEVRVTNDIGTYVVRPNQNVGTSLPGDAQSSSNHAVQWVLKSWGGSKSTEPTTTPPEVENHPNSPTDSTHPPQ